jgi:hypothetical protein
VLALAAAGCLAAGAADDSSSAPAASSAGAAAANGVSPAPAANPAANTDLAPNELADLEGFLRLPPDRITQLRKALDYLDSMTQLQRDALLRDVQARQNSIRQLRQEINGDTQKLSVADQSILARYEVTMLFPVAIQNLIKRFQDAGPDAKARGAIMQEMLKDAGDKGITAAPPNRPGNATRSNSTNPGRSRLSPDNGRGAHPPAPAGSTAPGSTTASP